MTTSGPIENTPLSDEEYSSLKIAVLAMLVLSTIILAALSQRVYLFGATLEIAIILQSAIFFLPTLILLSVWIILRRRPRPAVAKAEIPASTNA